MSQTTNNSTPRLPMSHALPDASASDYVIIPCSFADSSHFREMRYCRAKLWLWLLLEAAKNSISRKTGLQPGQISHSVRFIQDALAWGDIARHRVVTPFGATVLKDFDDLEKAGQIKKETVNGVGTVVGICNWESYQEKDEGVSPQGAIKLSSSFANSPEFRNMPYSRFKLWLWLLMEAAHVASTGNRGLGPGRIDHSIRVIQETLAWENPKRHRIVTPGLTTIMRDLKVLKERGQIEIESVRGIGTVVTIYNWEHYQGSNREEGQERRQEPTEECKEETQEDSANTSSSKDRVEEKKGSKKKNCQEADAEWKEKFIGLGRDFPETVSIYQEEWMPHVPIRRSVKDSFQARYRILNTLRLMHTQDGLPWEKIREIVRYCAQVSYPQGIIGSPAKLRQPVQDGSMKFWERTEQVMEAEKREAQEGW